MPKKSEDSIASKELRTAAAVAADIVSTAASSAVKVIADAAASALATINQRNTEGENDHDLIIQLDTKLDALKTDIQKLSDGTRLQVTDHETRIRTLEERVTKILTWGSAGMLILGVTQFLVGKFIR